MSVILTADAYGLKAGATANLSADEEAWALAHGVAKKNGYTGPGVSNTGPADVTPDKDQTLAVNREDPGTEYQSGSGDELPPRVYSISPASGVPGGGTVVTVTGDNFEGVSGVTFGGTPGTGFSLEVEDGDDVVKVTTPAHAAGKVPVGVVDSDGNTTVTNGFEYKA